MIKVYKHAAGSTECLDMVDPAWLQPGSGVVVWVDLDKPTAAEARVLTEVFHFHELSVEDALSEIHHPKVEWYGHYLYVILHGIDFKAREHYRPEVDHLHARLDKLEKEVFTRPDAALAKRILDFKRDVASLRRIVLPQRDVVGRLARREFPIISESLSFRFRDV